jgi:hypothetical protein
VRELDPFLGEHTGSGSRPGGPRFARADIRSEPGGPAAAEAQRAVEAKLDESFFRVRAERVTELELQYLRAMAELGPVSRALAT